MFQLLLAIIYLAFISLGLPDALLGSAWPIMYQEFCVPVSYMGIISMIIAAGTVVSSLMSDRLTKKLGTGKVTALSVLLTAIALFGFSISSSMWMLCLWAIPYGLGAGSVDAALNNYVALHYASRHMSWLHCMWGVGASVGPSIMGFALSHGQTWNAGYRYIAILQIVLTIVIIRLAGAKEIMIAFFCYSVIEQTTGQWGSSYLVLHKGLSEDTAATFAGLFYIGITIGRALSGFITMKLNDTQMIRLGEAIVLLGCIALILPLGPTVSLCGFILVGLGCAPIYPSIIHSTPANFGADKSQAVIGVQMAAAYVGTTLMPPLFGIIANNISIALLPVYVFAALLLMFLMYERVVKKCSN